VVIPAFRAEALIGATIADVFEHIPEAKGRIFVVDDGSGDATAERAREAGAIVLVHEKNRGKGAALVTGMREALARGFDTALTVDADRQHPGEACRAVLTAAPSGALILGIRDLAGAGAPRLNRFSNGISNFFLSSFAGRPLADTQCGLRRYPIAQTLALQAQSEGYAFEAEIVLLACAAQFPLAEVSVRVVYPPGKERVTHFDSVRDPMRIITTVLRTLARIRRDPSGVVDHAPAKPETCRPSSS
jgi:glycosyltransferase involved in cell wall biosynthesis